jgi:hypothetical protein
MGKYLGIIIVLLGVIATVKVVSDQLTERKAKINPWVSELRPLLAEHETVKISSEDASPWYAMEATYMQILAVLHNAKVHNYDPSATLSTALSGAQTGQSRMIHDSVMKSYRIADELGAFKDPANLIRMERGEQPYAKANGWEEEPLVLGHQLSPLLAPEAANHLANLVIMPKAAQDLQTHELREFTTETVKKWREEKIITPQSAKDIVDLLDSMKRR